MPQSVSKILSPNDIGLTGTHQAGIHVPRLEEILSFFPKLDKKVKNPRSMLPFFDDTGQRWEFWFIYYNNKFFGGTRNEYRLTHMTKFIRANNLKPGDELILTTGEDGIRLLNYRRLKSSSGLKLKLSEEWKVINFKPLK